MATILIVDDAPDIRMLIQRTLQRDGHQVLTLTSAKELTLAICQKVDLLILDVMMPEENGYDACKRIRQNVDCPILFLTAKDEENDVLNGFAVGGDDYITKPFRIQELRARIAAHLRRENRTPIERYLSGELSFDLSGKNIYYSGNKIPFTKGEYAICEVLAKHAGQAYSREQLLLGAFGYETDSDITAVTEHIKNIRNKLAQYHLSPIETVWGIGYKWNSEKAKV